MKKHSGSALLTDLYQLTMACGYHAHGRHLDRACFHLFYRRAPFGGGYAVAAGLGRALEWLEGLRVEPEEVEYLRSLKRFPEAFLELLSGAELSLDVAAIPEGTLAYPHEPMLRVEGPLWQAQLVETALLNMVNFETLIATKAARVCDVARDDEGQRESVLEFGLRRAQGPDGALSASRAAYLGGCTASSNVLAGATYGIPIAGTHAHSWVMTFGNDEEAFRRYAEVFPDSSVFLVDTFDTEEGVAAAIDVAREMRARGEELRGIRLDSGDLCALSIRAREMLDEAGFDTVQIVASNDLDEYRIAELKKNGARIDVWGVGTRLTTAFDQPALGGVYKLGAVQVGGEWEPRMKFGQRPIKRSIPGRLQVRRGATMDVIERVGEAATGSAYHPESDEAHPVDAELQPLLVDVMRDGRRTEAAADATDLKAARARALAAVDALPSEQRRHESPEVRFVGMEESLAAERRGWKHSQKKSGQ
ncbi:MAG: nicotinate phosphoribosyltransferase [Polyangiales bacterium]|jgi:nicotinate phosphoribosyltransferase